MVLRLMILALCSAVLTLSLASCHSSTPTQPNTTQYKGFIYYSTAGELHRMRMSDEHDDLLFMNARYPDLAADGTIIAVEKFPDRLIYTDVSGANRIELLNSQGASVPAYRRWMSRPRFSYDQNYIAYTGDKITNPVSYVIDSETGDLVATIGDYSKNQPLLSPSWAPDGSIYVCGYYNLNNGIYKVEADFSSYRRIDPGLSNVSLPNVSPNGKQIAFIRDGKVWTMNPDGSSATQLNTSIASFSMPTWSPDSKYIAAVDQSSGHIHILDPNALSDYEITNSHYVSDEQLCWRY